jgi:hypothetical protein
MRVLIVNYAKLLKEPLSGVERIAHFLGEPFARLYAVESIRPELHRQKA